MVGEDGVNSHSVIIVTVGYEGDPPVKEDNEIVDVVISDVARTCAGIV